ncbi:MAG: glycosyltransferase [Nanoarchaeota archaeon]|nr:glycosyltransferase [Nanoarchaeota archaeon]
MRAYQGLPKTDNPKVVYTGPLNDEQKSPFYSRARAFLMPIEWEEPFGLVMIEAMASGTPVVAYNRGSIPEIVVNGETGYIVENIDQMIDGVDKAISGSISSKACREHVVRNFSKEKMTEMYLEVYEEIRGK